MKRIIILLIILPMFISTAFAEPLSDEAADIFGADAAEEALSDEARSITGRLRTDGGYDVQGSLERLWKSFVDSAMNAFRSELNVCLELIAVGIVFNLAMTVCTSAGIKPFVNICACAAVAGVLVGNLEGAVQQTVNALISMSDYSRAAMPVLFTAAAACGRVGSSAAKYAAVSIAIDVMMSAARNAVIPLVYAYIAVTLSNCLFSNAILSNFAKITKWLAITVMTGMTIAFTAYINLTGLISGSADAAAIRTAKTLISTVLPVVGGIASDASSAVLAAAGVVKNSIGVFGLVAVAALCAGPFAVMSMKLLLLKAAGAVTDMLPYGGVSKLIWDIGSAVSILLGLLGCCGIMLFISTMAGIKAVNI